jgi:uncharacterized protein (TIGR03435 family)
MVGMRGGPGTADPTQATFTNVAKVPAGATREDFASMLQNLLAERFKMVVHNERKDAPIYALLTGKNGPKLTESPKVAPPDPAPDPATSGPNGGRVGPPRDKDGFPILRGGRGNIVLFSPDGHLRLAGGRMTMAQLSSTLSVYVGRPVVDMTGLQGEYDYKLEFTMEGLAIAKDLPPTPPGGDGGRGPEPAESGPSLFTALQEQLGLKLESRKGSVEHIVVDSAEKVPTEN